MLPPRLSCSARPDSFNLVHGHVWWTFSKRSSFFYCFSVFRPKKCERTLMLTEILSMMASSCVTNRWFSRTLPFFESGCVLCPAYVLTTPSLSPRHLMKFNHNSILMLPTASCQREVMSHLIQWTASPSSKFFMLGFCIVRHDRSGCNVLFNKLVLE